MIDFLSKLISFYIPSSTARKNVRRIFKNIVYGSNVLCKAKKIGKKLSIGYYSSINKSTYIGDHVRINGIRVEGNGKLTIGNNCQLGGTITVITSNHDYDTGSQIPFGPENIYKGVSISDFVWIGSNATLLPGTEIGEGAIIQGGAVVHGKIPDYAIAGGNPAKVFKYRDIEHFLELKKENKFLK